MGGRQREIGGAGAARSDDLVPAGRWTIDPEHSSVNFTVPYLGITTLRGRFADFSGSVEADGSDLRGEAAVDVRSVETGSTARDRHLQSADFLDADRHPRMAFRITRVRPNDDDHLVEGEVTINGVTRPIVLEAVTGGTARDPYGHDRVGLELRSAIRRGDFAIAFDPSGVLVGETVELEIDLSLLREPAPDGPRAAAIAASR